jgi:hypothetical protein
MPAVGCIETQRLGHAVDVALTSAALPNGLGLSNPFVRAHAGIFPRGKVLLLGASRNAVELAARGMSVSVFEHCPLRASQIQSEARLAGMRLDIKLMPMAQWRLGFQRWAGIVALFPEWPTLLRRQLVGAIPNALIPGGSFIFEGYAESQDAPQTYEEYAIDPDDFLPEIDVMHLSRFATVSRTIHGAAGNRKTANVLQVVATHLEASDWIECC